MKVIYHASSNDSDSKMNVYEQNIYSVTPVSHYRESSLNRIKNRQPG